MAKHPRIVGLGIYIWNVKASEEVVSILKRICPEILIVLGGPEVSHEIEGQRLYELADFIVAGEGDLIFHQLCNQYPFEGEIQL